MGTLRIDTQHLGMRPWTRADVDALHALWTDPGVRKYLWDDVIIPREQAEAVVETSLGCVEAHGFGFWAVFPRDQTRLIGFSGFRRLDETAEIEVLYGLASDCWGRGLATEALRAMLRYGFETSGFERVVGITDVANVTSARVMEKAGMSFDGRRVHHGLDSVFYTLSRDIFRPDLSPYAVRTAPAGT